MNFKVFIDAYDNWNGRVRVNDAQLNVLYDGPTKNVLDKCPELSKREVNAFGFYKGTLTVRLY